MQTRVYTCLTLYLTSTVYTWSVQRIKDRAGERSSLGERAITCKCFNAVNIFLFSLSQMVAIPVYKSDYSYSSTASV